MRLNLFKNFLVLVAILLTIGACDETSDSRKERSNDNRNNGQSCDPQVQNCQGQDQQGFQNQTPFTNQQLSDADKKACEFMKAQSVITSELSKQVAFLCDDGGFAKLRGSSYSGSGEPKLTKVVDDFETKSSSVPLINGISKWLYGNAMQVKAGMDKINTNDHIFCTDNDAYKAMAGSAMAKVKSITTSNVTDGGCDYEFVAKETFGFKPSYEAKIEYFFNEDKSIYLSAGHETKKLSLVEEANTLAVAVKVTESDVMIYTVITSVSESNGLAHSFAGAEMYNGTITVMKAIHAKHNGG